MKRLWLLNIVLALGLYTDVSCASGAGVRGGDMPFPIGKVIDLPIEQGPGGMWKVPQIERYIKINHHEVPTADGDLLIQLMGYKDLSVIAEGIGKVDGDKLLRAILKYKKQSRYVSLTLGSYCADDRPFPGSKSFSRESCVEPRYVAAFEPITGAGERGKVKAYSMRKHSVKANGKKRLRLNH